MRLVLWIVGALVALVAVLYAVGFALPAQFRVERSIEIAAPAERVYALIASPREWKRWSEWNQRDPNMTITYSGPEAGLDAAWAWQSQTEGNGEMRFTLAEPGGALGYELRFPDMQMVSQGDLKLDPTATGVRLSWSNEGRLEGSVSRWFGLYMDGLIGPDFEAGLKRLKVLAESGS